MNCEDRGPVTGPMKSAPSEHPEPSPFCASVIVPAYNEENRIGPLLPVLSEVSRELQYLVIVACNGCTDRTVEMAQAMPGLKILTIDLASKPHALNEAEREAGDVFPRLYVDADVRTDAHSLRLLVDALRVDTPLAVRPQESYLTSGAPWLAKAYYASRMSVPSLRLWLEQHIEGHHIYGTNAAGRSKFDVFPEEGQIMEDAFFDRMFDSEEKLAVLESRVEVPLPTSARSLIRGLTRIYQGNWELTAWLEMHRPDRVPVAQSPAASGRKISQVFRYYATGGSTFESWRPSTVIVALASLGSRAIAKSRAKRLVRAGRQADWR